MTLRLVDVKMDIQYVDYSRSKILKDGDVLFTTPADRPVPESWWRVMRIVRCGRYKMWNRVSAGCGVQICYEDGTPPPIVCGLCGSSELDGRLGSFGVLGFGPRPLSSDLSYRFAPLFANRRGVLEDLCDRRRAVDADAAARLTAVMRGLLSNWQARFTETPDV